MRKDALVVKDTKTHAGRRIALDPDTAHWLCAFRRSCEERAAMAGLELGQSAFVFTTALDGSRPRPPDGMSLAFIRLRRRAGASAT